MSEMSRPSRRPGHTGRGRTVGIIGLVLLLAGVGVLGYVGWQMFGTNIVSRHKADDLRRSTVSAWGQGRDGPALGLIRIPRFGTTYVKPIIRGFGEESLAKGVAWYPQGAKVGRIGNYVLAAHRVTHGEPFSKFPDLRKGDKVIIETRTAIYTYKLRNAGQSITVDFHTAWPLYPVPAPNGKGRKPHHRLITLLTCSELFHTNNRNVVIGDLVAKVAKAKPRQGPLGTPG
jgi:sortase A